MVLGRSSKQDPPPKKSINYRENNWHILPVKFLKHLYENTINNILRKEVVWKKIYASKQRGLIFRIYEDHL